jgi:peptide/nickel transport system substrate-binding protein
MERNPDYWRNPVQVDAVEFRYIPEFSSRLSALLAGEIDIMKDVPVDSIDTVNNGNEATAEEIESSRINYVALVNNRDGSVMADKRIRLAVNYAVDVDAIIKGVFQGHATRMAGALSHLNPDVNTEIKPYTNDPDKAKALLKEAGVDKLDVTMDAPQGRYPMDTDAAQAIASYLGEVGINVKVQYNEWGTHLDKIVNRRTGDMFYLGWGPALDAQGTLQFLFTGDSTYSGYTNKDVEATIATASKTVDPAKRKQLWDQVQQMVYDDAGWLFLWQQHDIYGVANEIDWQPRPDEFVWMGGAKPKAGS